MGKKGTLIKIVITIIALFLVVFFVGIIHNIFNAKYQSIEDNDKKLLSEIEQYCKANEKKEIWTDFDLHKKTILAVDGRFGKAFLINPSKPVHNFFAHEVKMPKEYSIKVYRVSALTPQLVQYRMLESFNQFEKTYKIFGSEVYFTRYDEDATSDKPCDSSHYITFLSHESFHYYMQREWKGGERFSTEDLTKQDLSLLGDEYDVLDKIKSELDRDLPNRNRLIGYTREYTDIVKQRITSNKQYMNRELMTETAEGTANYIGILSSEIVDYDFGIMKFCKDGKNIIEIPFGAIVPAIESGKMDKSAIPSNCVYESGALLCELIEELDVPNWKESLNAQTGDAHVTLYSLLSNYINEN